ncbi:hypothetical protein AXF42_Ash007869 [Apostasia shenzhenica]|uniref:Uncharacterized protein n=1 Tax=Apostasia shenzhenica TaxID=1088818 RepID=A0A2I0B5K6_9ASPA|nr:hypothetical protein AXF42_Ash007869 [Apostasia shenzhenica]
MASGIRSFVSNSGVVLLQNPCCSSQSSFSRNGFSGLIPCKQIYKNKDLVFSRKRGSGLSNIHSAFVIANSSNSASSAKNANDSNDKTNKEKAPFGYTRKDVLLIGLGVTVIGVGLKSGLEFVGVDPLQAGNVVQLVMVLGLTVGWISTYIFRVSNKDMTYAQQLRDYENKVMEVSMLEKKRLESLSEAEVEALLEQVEEEKERLAKEERV